MVVLKEAMVLFLERPTRRGSDKLSILATRITILILENCVFEACIMDYPQYITSRVHIKSQQLGGHLSSIKTKVIRTTLTHERCG
jgi:hypothetical protein